MQATNLKVKYDRPVSSDRLGGKNGGRFRVEADAIDDDGLSHYYRVMADVTHTEEVYDAGCFGFTQAVKMEVQFQKCEEGEEGSEPGITDEVLLAILIDRLRLTAKGKDTRHVYMKKLHEVLNWLRNGRGEDANKTV